MRSSAPCIVGLTLAVNLASLRGQPGVVTRSTWHRYSVAFPGTSSGYFGQEHGRIIDRSDRNELDILWITRHSSTGRDVNSNSSGINPLLSFKKGNGVFFFHTLDSILNVLELRRWKLVSCISGSSNID